VRMADRITEIVSARGKLHNLVTGSGGIVVGCVAEMGSAYAAEGLELNDRVIPLASLSLIPLTLREVRPLDPGSPQFPVRGRAMLLPIVPLARLPDDLPLAVVRAPLDVYGAAPHTPTLASTGARVTVIGAGRAGLLAAAAARESAGYASCVTVIDVREDVLENVRRAVPGARTASPDATDAPATQTALDVAGAQRARPYAARDQPGPVRARRRARHRTRCSGRPVLDGGKPDRLPRSARRPSRRRRACSWATTTHRTTEAMHWTCRAGMSVTHSLRTAGGDRDRMRLHAFHAGGERSDMAALTRSTQCSGRR
jgi:hypothetical protein